MERKDIMTSSDKKEADVIIGGKVYTISGYESEEYLQRVAAYINGRIAEYNKVDSYRRLPVETQHVLMLLNIADDYFKAKQSLDEVTSDLEKRDKEAYDLKHNLIVSMTKMDTLEKNFKELSEENTENQKKIIQLETELGREHEKTATGGKKSRPTV